MILVQIVFVPRDQNIVIFQKRHPRQLYFSIKSLIYIILTEYFGSSGITRLLSTTCGPVYFRKSKDEPRFN